MDLQDSKESEEYQQYFQRLEWIFTEHPKMFHNISLAYRDDLFQIFKNYRTILETKFR